MEKQLEGLRARLALGTKEDMSPELNFQGQEGGRSGDKDLYMHHQVILPCDLNSFTKRRGDLKKMDPSRLWDPGVPPPDIFLGKHLLGELKRVQ